MDKNTASSSSGGLCFILFIVFLVLKLCGVIAWPWVWIFSPLWIPMALVVAALLIMMLPVLIIKIFELRKGE